MTIRESAVESYLASAVALLGGHAFKFVSPGYSGVVDRVIVLPQGLPVWFVETKRPGKDLEPLQVLHRDWLISCQQHHAMLDTKAKVDSWIAKRAQDLFEAVMA